MHIEDSDQGSDWTDLSLRWSHRSFCRFYHSLTRIPSYSRLTELHLSLNNYESVDLPADTSHKSLTKLFINGCKLSRWADVAKLGACFPSLQFLNVIKSDIKSLEEENIVEAFPVLKNLNISGNPIASWEEIDKFRKFPSLENLRIADVPFLEVS